jgi:cytidylate kinase|tara:strand:+ start:526 stop:822 length:297 start_codon:yes stop_codon:yes gene_type:complete
MALEITVNNSEEFEELIKNQDLDTSKALVETVLKNLKGKKRHVHALSVNVIEDSSIYDITIDRNDFTSVLQKNIIPLEKFEEYEMCAEIMKALDYLRK